MSSCRTFQIKKPLHERIPELNKKGDRTLFILRKKLFWAYLHIFFTQLWKICGKDQEISFWYKKIRAYMIITISGIIRLHYLGNKLLNTSICEYQNTFYALALVMENFIFNTRR